MTYQKILEILSKCDFPNPEECGKNPQEMLTQDNCLQKIIIPLSDIIEPL